MHVNIKALVTGSVQTLVTKIFNKSLHNSAIKEMSVCPNKSIVAAISLSHQIKFWTHTTEWTAIANFDFEEQPNCLDLHPSGF